MWPTRPLPARIEQDTALVRKPKPFVCLGGTSSWFDLDITGRLDGKRVDVRTSTCWTTQMALIAALGIGPFIESHLVSAASHPLGSAPVPVPWPGRRPPFIDAPSETPPWLLVAAGRMAQGLGDPVPSYVFIFLGTRDRIRLRGQFACYACSVPYGAKTPMGTVVTGTYDPATRRETDF